MITGIHMLLYSKDAESDRAFLRDVLEFRAVDAGGGWLIFRLPPAEIGIHPDDGDFTQLHAEHALAGAVLYLMCDDLGATLGWLDARGVRCSDVKEAEWGKATTIRLPSGRELGLYQPSHPIALNL